MTIPPVEPPPHHFTVNPASLVLYIEEMINRLGSLGDRLQAHADKRPILKDRDPGKPNDQT